jgi:hypothetical protein
MRPQPLRPIFMDERKIYELGIYLSPAFALIGLILLMRGLYFMKTSKRKCIPWGLLILIASVVLFYYSANMRGTFGG